MINLLEWGWRKRRGWSLSRLAASRRVLLHLRQDGRHLAFLLRCIEAAGFGVVVANTPFLYRELLCLRRTTALPFLFARPNRLPKVHYVITDEPDFDPLPSARRILLNYEYFIELSNEIRMPYFMHPSAYHAGLDRITVPDASCARPHRIGFFGTHAAAFYRQHFHFPILDRTSIIELFLEQFGDLVVRVHGTPAAWPNTKVVAAIDQRGGDHKEKSFLSRSDYFKALQLCDFILCPPGWCMPLSHNLVESMAMGAIPITNSSQWTNPPLEDRKNCLHFDSKESFVQAMEAALKFSAVDIQAMRSQVMKYYAETMSPEGWFEKNVQQQANSTLVVNAEECSVWLDPIMRPRV